MKSAIRAAEYFWPLQAFRHVESVRKHQTGLERGQWLPRKLRITVLTLASSHPVAFHRNSQFSRQPLAAFESRFDFSDLPNTLDHLQTPKTTRSANLRLRFPRQVAFWHALDFLGNFRLSQRPLNLVEFRFVILDRFYTSKHSMGSKTFSRAI
jgi:hypothetical protein